MYDTQAPQDPWYPPRSTARGRRWWLSRGVVAAVVIIALVCVQALATSHPGPVRGAFAGYSLPTHDLHSVSGSWTVPRLTGAASGMAAVWIGAQAPGSAGRAPFVQVGVVMHAAGADATSYLAFWSDTAHGFRPQPLLMIVAPGDHLDAGLDLRGGQWRVTLDDTTTGMRQSVTAPAATNADFNYAEWAQEDPSSARAPHHRLPYASTSSVRFVDLLADGRAPGAGALTTQWMTFPRSELAPTPLRADAFSIVPRD